MAEWTLPVATAIFVATYALLSFRTVRSYRLDRPAVALFGAALMVGLGIVAPAEAIDAISLDVLLLLLGMMLLVAGLDVCGFFDLATRRIVVAARSPFHFLVLLMAVTAVLSALVLNDTIVLIMTPIVVKTARTMKVNPVPFLVGEALAANIGGVATQVGNPQNAYLAIQSGIPFVAFAAAMLPIAVASFVVALGFVALAFRRDLKAPVADFTPAVAAAPVIVRPRGLALTFLVLGWAVAAFFVSPPSMLPFIALIGGAVVLLVLPALESTTPRRLFEKVDWSLLVLFIGLFIVMKGVETSGLLDQIVAAFGGPSGVSNPWWLSGVSGVLSNLISNVPAVLLLAPIVAAAPVAAQGGLWLVLAASSTLAGNATILGAAANLIVVQVAAKAGAEVSLKDFMKAGLPTALVTVILATALLAA